MGKRNKSLKPGDLVWVRINHKPWPGWMCHPPPKLKQELNGMGHYIYLFGTHEFVIMNCNISSYLKHKKRMLRLSKAKAFREAVEQAEECINNPERFNEIEKLALKSKPNRKLQQESDNSSSHESESDDEEDAVLEPDKLAMIPCIKLERLQLIQCKHCDETFYWKWAYLKHKVKHTVVKSKLQLNSVFKHKPYKCKECDAAFVLHTTLAIHMKVHEPYSHVCYCGVGFRKSSDLNGHKLLVHPISKMGLPVVKQEIIYKDDIKVVKKENKFKNGQKANVKRLLKPTPKRIRLTPPSTVCEICQKEFPSQGQLSVHYRDNHTSEGFKCPTCKKIFNSRSNLKIHLITHTGERRFACKICGKRFTQPGSKKYCEMRHSGVLDHECSFCNRRFLTKDHLVRHERVHTGDKPFLCDYCPKTFGDPSARNRHIRLHTGEKPYSCPYCPKKFSDSGQFTRHKQFHENTRNYKCDKCGKSCRTKPDLRSHMKFSHGKKQRHQCVLCPKVFHFEEYLRHHMWNAHNDVKYECDMCHVKYALKSELEKHVKTQHLINLYCNVCLKCYYSETLLAIHKRLGCKRIACEICGSSFVDYNLLEEHELSMHGSPQIQCDHCGEKFQHKAEMYKHMADTHLIL